MGSLLSSMAHDFQESEHDVRFLAGATLEPTLAQTSSLRRCIGNLVENAVRYGHRARITLTDRQGVLHVAVADDGPGIAQNELGKVLAP